MTVDLDGKHSNSNHWHLLGAELRKRSLGPFRHPSFIFFFVVAILGIGPTGVWIELIGYLTIANAKIDALRSAFISFLPAFLAATCMQLILAEDDKRSLRACSLFILAICGAGLGIIGNVSVKEAAQSTIGAVLFILAMWLWWIANANQKEFMDDKSIVNDSSLGGDPAAPLKGDLNSFTV